MRKFLLFVSLLAASCGTHEKRAAKISGEVNIIPQPTGGYLAMWQICAFPNESLYIRPILIYNRDIFNQDNFVPSFRVGARPNIVGYRR